MTDVTEILVARRGTHGDFTVNARVAQTMLRVMMAEELGWGRLSDVQREALWMLCHKMARIVGGDPNHHDHWDDIAGYARLARDRIPRPTIEELERILREPEDGVPARPDGSVMRPREEKLRMEVHPDIFTRPGTPEDGGHHEPQCSEPWTISATRGRRLPAIVGNTLYDYHHRDWWKLVPALAPECRLEVSRVAGGMPRDEDRAMLRAALRLYDGVNGWHVLRVAEAPSEDRELWPTLRRELNHAEYVEMLDWQKPLYDRDEPAAKWVLREEHLAWARE